MLIKNKILKQYKNPQSKICNVYVAQGQAAKSAIVLRQQTLSCQKFQFLIGVN